MKTSTLKKLKMSKKLRRKSQIIARLRLKQETYEQMFHIDDLKKF